MSRLRIKVAEMMTTKQLKEELTHESGEGTVLTARVIIGRAIGLDKYADCERVAVALYEVLDEMGLLSE